MLSQEWKEALWEKFVMGAPRPRMPSEQQYRDPLPGEALQSNVAKGARFARASEPVVGHQLQDGCEVADAGDGR